MSDDTNTETKKEWMSDAEIASWLGIGRKKLQLDRARGEGLPFVRIGRSVRYRRADVEVYLLHASSK